MLICEYVELKAEDFKAILHVRSDLRQQIEKYWVGRKNATIGLGQARLKDGILTPSPFFRRDIALLQAFGKVNVFIRTDGTYTTNVWGEKGGSLDADDKQVIEKIVKAWMLENITYVQVQQLYFDEEPWKAVDGLTPEQAVAKLKELGW